MTKKAEMIKEIIDYCEPHLEMMWAATMVGIALDCDFQDCYYRVSEYREIARKKLERDQIKARQIVIE